MRALLSAPAAAVSFHPRFSSLPSVFEEVEELTTGSCDLLASVFPVVGETAPPPPDHDWIDEKRRKVESSHGAEIFSTESDGEGEAQADVPSHLLDDSSQGLFDFISSRPCVF